MRLPTSQFQAAIRAATTATGLTATVLSTSRAVAGAAVCQQVGVEVLQDFVTEANTSLGRLRGSLRGGLAAWGRILAGRLEGGMSAVTAVIDRAGRQALSTASAYALEFAQRKAYAVAGVIDIAINAPEAFEQAVAASVHVKALEHINAFKSAVLAIGQKVNIIQQAVRLTEGRSDEDGEAYHNFDFSRALKDIKLAESALSQEQPSGTASVSRIDSAITVLATGRTGGGVAEDDTESLLAVFASGLQREEALEFLGMPGPSLVDLVERGIESNIFAPIEAAYFAAAELDDLIGTAAKEYGLALEWIDRLRAVENIMVLTRRAVAGVRSDFFVVRAIQQLRLVIADVEEFSASDFSDSGEFRFRTSVKLFNIRTEISAFQGTNTDAIQAIRSAQTGALAPDAPGPRLFQPRGQATVNRMEVVLRLVMASLGRVTGQTERTTAVTGLLTEAVVLADEAIETLGPSPSVPPSWTTVLMLMREAGVDKPLDEIVSGQLAGRAVDAYRTIGEAWSQVGQLRTALKKKPPQVPCAPAQLVSAPAIAERAVGLRISNEVIEQIRATTALDAIDASHRVAEARVFALDRILGLATPSPPPGNA